jgi:hypothetical protein
MKTQMTTTMHDLVVNCLHPGAVVMTAKEIKEWHNKLKEVEDELFQTMSILVYAPIAEELVNRHIRQIHHEGICLIDILEGYEDITVAHKKLYQATLDMLIGVHHKIENYYPEYFNLDLAIPNSHFKQAVLQLEEKMDAFRTCLNTKCPDKALKKLILDSLSDFMTAKKCSFYRLSYILCLQEEVTALCSLTARDEGNEKIRELLIFLNLNTNAHIRYYKKIIAQELAETFDTVEQGELLYAYQKQIRTINPLEDSGFSPKNHSIKKMILDYLSAEIRYRRKLQQLPAAQQSPPGSVAWSMPSDPYKLQVAFSVEALAYFLKMAVKAGMINGTSKTQLMDFVAKNMRTPATLKISANSLLKKYDQATQTTAKGVRSLLMRMLGLIQEEFDFAK